MKGFVTPLVIIVVLLLASPPLAIAVETGNDAFQRTWDRTDRPVEQLVEPRTWMWGPLFDRRIEDYDGSPYGARQVVYFDKSRMEINRPDGDPSSSWYVTNGLLVAELITGRMQVGDQQWVQREPSNASVAGNPDGAVGPTYATFAPLTSAPARPDGALITQRLTRDGSVTDDGSLAAYEARAAFRVQLPGLDHQVASPFWDFMNAVGVVWEDGAYVSDQLFESPFYATGLPITEAYWTTVQVGDDVRDVLIQCFERRVLTWTPANPAGWQVESGNVGRHYHAWRYGPLYELHQGRILYQTAQQHVPDLHVIGVDGTQRIDFAANGVGGYQPRWSPDGRMIAFSSFADHADRIWIVNRDGSGGRELAGQPADHDNAAVAWSPDGTRILINAWSARPQYPGVLVGVLSLDGTFDVLTDDGSYGGSWSPDGARVVVHHDGEIVVIDVASGERTVVAADERAGYMPAWSPAGDRIAYRTSSEGIAVMDTDGSNWRQLTPAGVIALTWPIWSPDGAQLAYVQHIDDPTGNRGLADLWLLDAATGAARQITFDARLGVNGSASWSPDGAFLAYADGDFDRTVIRIVEIEHPERAYPAVAFGVGPQWSPGDGP